MNTELSRRKFIGGAAAMAGSVLAASWPPRARAAAAGSANRRLRVAVAGTNSRGQAHVKAFAAVPDTEIAYICDVDESALAKGMAEAARVQWTAPKPVKDFRRALEDRDVDAIAIATPDHWHAPMAILALAAGKHVFLEKPCSHSPREGELLIEAVRRSGRVLQMGNQRRSFRAMQEAVALIRGGAIGRAYFARGWYANTRKSIGRGKSAPVPRELDFELWQGPAPRRPYVDNLVHYNWHWFWNWGTGEALNNGTHEMDVARWALGVDHPVKVTSAGGRYHFDDDWETPDTQTIGWEFPGGVAMSWEGRSCNGYPVEGRLRGAMIHGTEGSALLDAEEYIFYDLKNNVTRERRAAGAADPTNPVSSTSFEEEVRHFRNFADAIRDGAKPNSPIEEAHKSVTMLQLGNIAQRVGRTLRCDAKTGRPIEDAEAMKLWSREYEPGWEPKV